MVVERHLICNDAQSNVRLLPVVPTKCCMMQEEFGLYEAVLHNILKSTAAVTLLSMKSTGLL